MPPLVGVCTYLPMLVRVSGGRPEGAGSLRAWYRLPACAPAPAPMACRWAGTGVRYSTLVLQQASTAAPVPCRPPPLPALPAPPPGLIMVANDSPNMHAYFVPSLGPAPRWCSHLEGLTEELEEAAPAVYDDYRFVTRADLARLGLDHLLGTPMLRAYMHGFFVDNRCGCCCCCCCCCCCRCCCRCCLGWRCCCCTWLVPRAGQGSWRGPVLCHAHLS